jgi:hypothetical protein
VTKSSADLLSGRALTIIIIDDSLRGKCVWQAML